MHGSDKLIEYLTALAQLMWTARVDRKGQIRVGAV